jgi:hypothetical protein
MTTPPPTINSLFFLFFLLSFSNLPIVGESIAKSSVNADPLLLIGDQLDLNDGPGSLFFSSFDVGSSYG